MHLSPAVNNIMPFHADVKHDRSYSSPRKVKQGNPVWKDPVEVGRIVREIRERLGLNQTEMGERLGVHQTVISKWEKGKGAPPSARRMAQIAGLVDQPVEIFMRRSPDLSFTDEQGRRIHGEAKGVTSPPLELLRTVEVPEGVRRMAGRPRVLTIFAHVYAIGVDEGFTDEELKVLESWRDAELAKLREEERG